MEKKKTEQLILILLIPVLLVSFGYVAINNISKARKEKKSQAAQEIKEDGRIDTIKKPKGALSIVYEGGERDPLKDLLQMFIINLEIEKKKKPDAGKTAVPMPQLSIEGLVWNAAMPQAIVKGKVVKIGDSIEGVKVVKITKEGITVEHEGEEVFVSKK
jgi:membrane protein implicated in regulation of membrane protease activity